MADRKISFVRHGDSVVWIETENGVTTTRTEHAPLEISGNPFGNPFLRDALAQIEGTSLQPAVRLAPPVFREGPAPAATPVPPRTTVVTVAGNTGTTTKTIQHGAPFTGGQFLMAFFVLFALMAWALLMVRKPTTG